MDARQKNYLALAGMALVLAGSLLTLFPFKQPDNVSWSERSEEHTSELQSLS
jgi:hypothetical protein